MPIELITGLPGNAKTLHALERCIARSSSENRPVYYAGLKEFVVGDERLKGVQWTEIDPLKWHEDVPSGSIIFIDECQKIFRNRSLGAQAPKHVTELEEHRHKGLDFYMITQHPSLIDPAVRKLTQTHHHMMRIMGMEASTVHTWSTGVKDNCDKPGGRTDSEKVRWGFNKGLYGLYKSADVHTVKRKIPGRVKMLGVLVLLFAAMVYYMVGFLGKKTGMVEADQVAASTGVSAAVPGAVQPGGTVQAAFDPIRDAQSYVQRETPRVAGLPHTAPKYDELTSPSRVPVPAACIQIGEGRPGKPAPRCKCFTQKGTPMDVEYNMCISIVHNGYFLDFDPEGGERADRAERSREVLSSKPDAPLPDRPAGPSVVAFTVVPEVSRLTGRPGS